MLTYRAKLEGVEVADVSKRETSKTCCVCGREDAVSGLNVACTCEACDVAVTGAENIRLASTGERNFESSGQLSGDRSAGWLAYAESPFMTTPEDSTLGQRCETANHTLPTQQCVVGFPRVHARKDINRSLWTDDGTEMMDIGGRT